MASLGERFVDQAAGEPAVDGYLHVPAAPCGNGLVLAHGAGSNCNAPLLVALAQEFSRAGLRVLRCNLPFRQRRPHGPPPRGSAAEDQRGLLRALKVLAATAPGQLFLGGHSYGGRQATLATAAERPGIAGLLLLSYPLHPPHRPADLRTAHFPQLSSPALFVHGAKDPFGSREEMETALELIPAPTKLLMAAGEGHSLLGKRNREELPRQVLAAFMDFFNLPITQLADSSCDLRQK
jgi:hypothetical protein